MQMYISHDKKVLETVTLTVRQSDREREREREREFKAAG